MTEIPSIPPASPEERFRVLIVHSPYYEHIASQLLEGAKSTLEAAGCEIEVASVPGALEIPGTISIAYEFGDYDGFVALGCVIRGETTHYEIVSGESARGLMDLCIDGACIGNGILTVENEAQAVTRASVAEMNKGAGAAEACLAMMKFRLDQESRDD
ncbi:MAG: 6,7-dimethyl-8-ribityllumazine synthase [Pseudomonadota bacterium]